MEFKIPMIYRLLITLIVGLAAASIQGMLAAEPPVVSGPIKVEPAAMNLVHQRQPHSIIVTASAADGRAIDLTSQATYASSNPAIARVTSLGRVEPVATGEAMVTV